MIHVVSGPPCSGKSTYVDEHARPGDMRVDMDRIAVALGADTGHLLRPGVIRDAAMAARDAARAVAMDNPDHESWIIDSRPSEAALGAYEAIGADMVALDPGVDECVARAEADGRPDGTIGLIRAWYDDAAKGVSTMPTKSFDFQVKSSDMDEGGRFRAYFSTFDLEPDSYGDVVRPGAFTDCIDAYKASGTMPMFLWGHDTSDPLSNIGTITDIGEDSIGAWCEGKFDLDGDNERAAYAYKLAREGRVVKFSFAYETLDEALVDLPDGRRANELRRVNVFEVSLVPIPANRHAGITEIKSIDADAYEKLSGALNDAATALNEFIELFKAQSPEGDEEDTGDNAEEPSGANAEDRASLKSRITLELMKQYV